MLNRRLIKPVPYRDPQYLRFVREFPCLVCGSTDVQAAHSGRHGIATKASDLRAVPLCPLHHQGDSGLDTIGFEAFEKLHNVDLREECLWLLNAYLGSGHALIQT